MSGDARLSPIDAANLLAGQAVAEAEAYLAERRDAAQIEPVIDQLWRAHDAILNRSAPAPDILVPVRLLIMALFRVSRADADERRAKWRRVLAALTDLVRHESLALRPKPGPARDSHGDRRGAELRPGERPGEGRDAVRDIPFSLVLTDLLAFSETLLRGPQMTVHPHVAQSFAEMAAEIARRHTQPAEGVRVTRAAIIMVTAIEAFLADKESSWLMLAGCTLPLLREEAWQAMVNEKEARALDREGQRR